MTLDQDDRTFFVRMRTLTPHLLAMRNRPTDCASRRRPVSQVALRAVGLLLALVCFALATSRAKAQVNFAVGSADEPIQVSAERAIRWNDGLADVWVLSGQCLVNQGLVYARSNGAVLWIEKGMQDGRGNIRVTAYLDGDVSLNQQSTVTGEPASTYRSNKWIGEFRGSRLPGMQVAQIQDGPPARSLLLERAMAARFPRGDGLIRQAQFNESVIEPTADTPPPGLRRIRAFPRSDVRVQAQMFPRNDRGEFVAVVSGGIMVIVDGVDKLGSVDLSADRVVIWTAGGENFDLTGQNMQRADAPLEVYMEGNIEFRQGDRVIFANRMYYDVRHQVGVVLDAELLTPVPDYNGKLRVKADVLRQISKDKFLAQQALITSSRMGVPGYSLRSEQVYFEDIQTPLSQNFWEGASEVPGQPPAEAATAQHRRIARARNNFIYVGDFPVFYWPTLVSSVDKPTFYLDGIRLGSDSIFGTQIQTRWNTYEVFGIENPIEGTDWTFDLDYLSDRGLGVGSDFEYQMNQFFGMPGLTTGFIDAWGIKDHGLDDLGADRRALFPEQDFRGRIRGQHRQQLSGGFQLSGEVGIISDRNFLEQYYEQEWDNFTDQETKLELKRYIGNRSWDVYGSVRPNDFVTQTQWLPRADHFWLGESLLGDRLTWFEHSQAGYANYRTASAPQNPEDIAKFALLPWEVAQSGERLATRQEIDLPFQVGNFKVVPFALGELAHWGADINGDPIDRAYGQLGVRASLPMWRVDPNVHLPVLNVNGLAHKVVFSAEASYSDANRNFDEFPLYDAITDNSIEAFQRRYQFDTFGGVPGIPAPFDPRYYAIRSGIGNHVTSPTTELVDDISVVRLGVKQRWQTKRGLPGEQRIIDWITLDTNVSLFPDEDQNFGEYVGLADFTFRWHLGDRFTVHSSGIADVFTDGQKQFDIGASINRPEQGNIYYGLRVLEGPISNQVGLSSFNYRMSPKWIVSGGGSIDFSDDGNVATFLAMTRLGESFLVRFGIDYDQGRDNVGFKLAIEPRLFSSRGQRTVEGIYVPPAGAFGLE